MSGETPDPRQRIVAGAADMMRRRGLAAMSVRDLAKHAHAPLGSTYHYFPGGKEQLATEAVHFAGDVVARILRRELAAGPVAGLRAFLALWREVVTGSDFRAGCPVLAVSVEDDAAAGPTPPVAAAAEVFATWRSLLAESLRAHGVEPRDAGQLATLVVAAAEGAVVLCRATRDAGPLDDVAAQLDALLSAAVSDHP